MNAQNERAVISYKELDLVFIHSYYDIPLKGLCRYDGKLALFEVNDDDFYIITELNSLQKLRVLLHKWAFEFCVGKHCSYKDGKVCGEFKEFTQLSRFYYWVRK